MDENESMDKWMSEWVDGWVDGRISQSHKVARRLLSEPEVEPDNTLLGV